MTVRCFLLERVPKQVRYLRRFTYSGDDGRPCPELEGGHEAWHRLDVTDDPVWDVEDHEEIRERGQQAEEAGDRDALRKLCTGDLWPHSDERWPEACAACGYEFAQEDPWQLHLRDLYKPVDLERFEELPQELEFGRLTTLQEAPPGAMWHAWWLTPHSRTEDPDGLSLVVKTPDGFDWHIDGTASYGQPGWEREGEPPNITVSPSIGTPNYHGFLVDGEFTDDLEGRTYDV